MIEEHEPDVAAAFEMLLEEISKEIRLTNKDGAMAFAAGNYDMAREALARAGQLTGFRSQAAVLRDRWHATHVARSATTFAALQGRHDSRPCRAGDRRN